MRIKRIIALALCLILACLTLASCEEEIGSYLKNYDYEPEKVVNMEFDLYIIVGEGTDVNAMTTVNEKISQALNEKYKTKLNIEYLTEAEYEETVNAVVDGSSVNDKYVADVENERVNVGKIVLVTSEAMMDRFMATDKLSDLSAFVYNDEYKYDFGTLKTQIPEDLMNAAKTEDGKLYAIPNNHVVGEYEYLVFNRMAAQKLNYVDTKNSELRSMVTLEDCGDLVNYLYDNATDTLYYVDPVSEKTYSVAFGNDGAENRTEVISAPDTVEPLVRLVKGPYEDQITYIEKGYVCNVSTYPECSRTEAFESAFAIIAESDVYNWVDSNKNKQMDAEEKTAAELVAARSEVAKRAMQVIYSINSDVKVRNYLQYGIEGINYKFDDENNCIGSYITEDRNTYYMDLKYTGDVFKAYFCPGAYDEENVWTKDMYDNGVNQNKKVNYYEDIYMKN